mmetsp:Transcript_58852/g.119838  ORF Transcript_58852/g.119838 Transcript_58852/m.119838 type:complete len:613 (+) Transcript_58852:144-1982(+)
MPNKFTSAFSSFGDSIKDAAGNVMDKIDDKIDMPIIIDFVGIKAAGDDCYERARETSGLCQTTILKASEMVNFGREIQSTLDDMVGVKRTGSRGIDSSKFEIIQDLVDGDRIRQATELAKELSGLSLLCVEKSKEMMVSMEKGIDALPDVVEPFVKNKIQRAKKKGSRNGDPQMPDVGASIDELKGLVDEVENVNLFNVVDRGSAAFRGLRKNGELSKSMFGSIKKFAEDVETVSGSFRDLEPDKPARAIGKVRTAAKSAWRCLKLSGLMHAFAEEVGKLIQWLISLFQAASSKLGSIWGALANARKVLGACLSSVTESMRLCKESKTKSLLLKSTSGEIKDHLSSILGFTGGPSRAMGSLLELADGDEIRLCIELGTTIDELFSACIQQVIGTIDKVERAIEDMPEVLKQDMPEAVPVDEADDGDDDIEFEDYEDGDRSLVPSSASRSRAVATSRVKSLEDMAASIENASALTVIQRSADGFDGVHEAVGVCTEMIGNSRSFAQPCHNAIESFNHGEWNLEAASGHLREIFEIRDAGIAMRVLAESILELVRANIALMRAVRTKTKRLSNGGDENSSGAAVAANLVGSLASGNVDLDDIGQGIQALGSLFR